MKIWNEETGVECLKPCKEFYMAEIIFLVDEVPEGGFVAQSFGPPITTQAQTWDELKVEIQKALLVNFDEDHRPSYSDIKTYLRCCG